MSDFGKGIEIFNKLKDFSEAEKEQIIEIHKTRIANQAAFIIAAHAINSKANLIELAALITPIAGLAGVFLWGFQRKD